MTCPPTTAPRVLLVDDDHKLLQALARNLREYEFQIETATCAAEAKAFLNHYSFEVIICDQSMPGKSGLELLTELRTEYPDLITIMLSGQIDGIPVAQNWAEEIGVSKVLAKPCHSDVVAAAIKDSCCSLR